MKGALDNIDVPTDTEDLNTTKLSDTKQDDDTDEEPTNKMEQNDNEDDRNDEHYSTIADGNRKGDTNRPDPAIPPRQWQPPNEGDEENNHNNEMALNIEHNNEHDEGGEDNCNNNEQKQNNEHNNEHDEFDEDNDGDHDPGNTFTVLENYDAGFLNHSKLITITELVANREEHQPDRLSLDFFAQKAKKQKRESSFIFGLLLRVNVPNTKSTTDTSFPAFKKNRFDRKPKAVATYKKCLLFADLTDVSQLPFVILEDNNEQHNRLFKRDLSLENVIVGNRCAILTPKLDGAQLKNGAWVVTTNRPIEFLGGPRVPTRPLRSERIGHEIRYFIIKNKPLLILNDDVVDPFKTKCNFHTCDRHNSATLGNTGCGCWVQNRRCDNGPRNTVLMFPFYFEDSNHKIQKVNDYTSLRTSKLFFEGNNILADTDTLQKNVVYEYMQQQWRRTIEHVNTNGGWTIIGWYIRAKVEDEDKEDNDEDLYRATVKINVSYLYPSKKKALPIPKRKTIRQSVIQSMIREDDQESGGEDSDAQV